MTTSIASNNISNVIFGCAGLSLSADERSFFSDTAPLGFIFFKRNVADPTQFKTLVDECRACIGDRPALLLIDQEGGRVQRFGPPHWRHFPPLGVFGEMYESMVDEREKILKALELNIKALAVDLRLLGLNVNCLPLLDVPAQGGDNIIGDRAFSNQVDTVITLGKTVTSALKSEGVLPVIKHIPGHGRALVDSHKALPTVDTPLKTLEDTDFKAFAPFAGELLAMTAHVTYSAIDAHAPATFSQTIVREIIRGQIGFSGLLMSDDLSMDALDGDFSQRARKTLAAGVDILLHCNGDMVEMQAIASEAKPLDNMQKAKLEKATNDISIEHSSRQELEDEYDALSAHLAAKIKKQS